MRIDIAREFLLRKILSKINCEKYLYAYQILKTFQSVKKLHAIQYVAHCFEIN